MSRRPLTVLTGIAACVAAATLIFAPPSRAADSSNILTLQGRINVGGVPVDGTLDLTFEIHTDPAAGSAVFSEAHAAVPVRKGVFAVQLGSATATGVPLAAFQPAGDRCSPDRIDRTRLTRNR